jgi:hypothetical protein
MTTEMLEQARAKTTKKGLTAQAGVRLERFTEGCSADHPRRSVCNRTADDRASACVYRRAGLRRRGRHHELYLSDPLRSAAEKTKTIIRQP